MTAPATHLHDQPFQDPKIGSSNWHDCKGYLVTLRTKAELQSKLSLIDAYTVEIPLKAANEVVKCFPLSQQDGINLQHLRRFAKIGCLPPHTREGSSHPSNDRGCVLQSSLAGPIASCPMLHAGYEMNGESQAKVDQSKQQTIHLLICATSQMSHDQVVNTLSSSTPFSNSDKPPEIRTISVPAQPPTSQEQAQKWSLLHWPTVYKKHNPHGAHPSTVSRAEDEMRPLIGKWMALAKQVSIQCHIEDVGEPIGTVIIDPTTSGGPAAVAVAGDARWKGNMFSTVEGKRCGNGNAMAHSIMRAIGLVARKRRALLSTQSPLSAEPSHPQQISQDYPIFPLEASILAQDTLKPGGYLCTDLEIYTTHEPCVMCSMAILHSRFEKVIFGRRMPRTGGLTAETGGGGAGEKEEQKDGLGYGLFWLPELNWKLLAWQWVEEDGDTEGEDDEDFIRRNLAATVHA